MSDMFRITRIPLLLTVLLWGFLFVSLQARPARELSEVRFSLPAESDVSSHKTSNFDISIAEDAVAKKELRNVHAAVVPHHLLAHPIITETLGRIARTEVKKVVLLAPNHEEVGKYPVFTSAADWETKFGIVPADRTFVEKLVARNLTREDRAVVGAEHGVSNLIPYIRFFFPEARVVPLIIKAGFSKDERDALAEFFSENLDPGDLLIVSADFSHYVPRRVAELHDQTSVAALFNLDLEAVARLAVDAPSALGVAMRYLQLRGAEQFTLVRNMNSADFGGAGDSADITSYVSGYFTQGPAVRKEELTILAVGDVMLDRAIYSKTAAAGNFSHPVLKLAPFLKGADLRIANLEGPITNFASRSLKDRKLLVFTISPRFLKMLKAHFDMVSLANNHAFDFGESGFLQTKEFLAGHAIRFFGHPKNRDTQSATFQKNGIRVAVVGYHELAGTGRQAVVDEIVRLRPDSDFIILYPHWGVEYGDDPLERIRKEAHEFIDAGVDVILGSHPHVVQPIEEYRGKYIFYSMGNFVFDQYFSERVKEGIAVGIDIEKVYNIVSASYYIFPVRIATSGQTELANAEASQKTLEWLASHSRMDPRRRSAIRSGLLE